jgi:hypothetical protein
MGWSLMLNLLILVAVAVLVVGYPDRLSLVPLLLGRVGGAAAPRASTGRPGGYIPHKPKPASRPKVTPPRPYKPRHKKPTNRRKSRATARR